MNETCLICSSNNTISDFLIVSSNSCINLCQNCFHLQRSNLMYNSCKKNIHFNENLYKSFIIKCFNKHKNKERIKILNINDNNTNILDDLLDDILNTTQLPKSYIKTVSLSLNFNPSFFSKHKCYKDVLSENSVQYIKNEYDTFDFIILNTTLINSIDPNNVLKLCYTLCNSDTNIVLINYHSMSPLDYMNIDISLQHFFNTNSLKLLCLKNMFMLNDVDEFENNWTFYEITYQHKEYNSKNIVSKLYNDILNNIYDMDTYDQIKQIWFCKVIETTKILERYKSAYYKLINIKHCKCCQIDNFLQNYEIINYQIDDLSKLKLNKILIKDQKYIFIIDDKCKNTLKQYLKDLNFELSYFLVYDFNHLITHSI